MKAKDIKLDQINNTWRDVLTLSSGVYGEMIVVFIKCLKSFDEWIITLLERLETGEIFTTDLLAFEENLTVSVQENLGNLRFLS